MSNLLTLIKVNLRETFDKRKFKENKKQQSFFIYMIIMGVLFVGVSTLYSFIYAMQYVASGNLDSLYSLTIMFFIASTLFVFSSAVSRIQSIFLGNDFELLAALPIRKRDIVAAKCFNLYLSELIVCLIALIPNAFVNFALTLDYRYLLIVPLAFITPAFPMLVSLIIVALIELTIKNPRVKNVISTVILLGLTMGIIIISMLSGFTSSSQSAPSMFDMIASKALYVNPSLLFILLAFTDNIAYILAYVGSNLLLLFLVLFIVVITYNRIHSNMLATTLSSQTKKNKKAIQFKSQSQFKAIMSLTTKQFFKSKNSVIQCGIGCIMTIVFTVVVVVLSHQSITIETSEGAVDLMEMARPYLFIFPIFLAIFSGILPPSATAVSLEGKNFYTLKTLPISFKKYLIAKVLFSMFFLGSASLISSLIWVIFVPQDVFSIIVSIVFPLAYSIFTAIFTLMINAMYPYLKWKEEIEVFKYHKSTIITVFSDMLISFTALGLAIILCIFNKYLAGIAVTSIFIVLDIILYAILTTKTSRKLQFLEVAD